jgi:hypothetical protein
MVKSQNKINLKYDSKQKKNNQKNDDRI